MYSELLEICQIYTYGNNAKSSHLIKIAKQNRYSLIVCFDTIGIRHAM